MRLTSFAAQLSTAVAACLALSACVVPQARYDALATAHAAEQRKNKQQAGQVAALNAQLQKTQAAFAALEERLGEQGRELDEKQQALEARAASLAETEYQSSVTQSQREAAESLVDQLRQELARVAGHVASLSEAKEKISAERDDNARQLAEVRARLATLEVEANNALRHAELTRDLSVQLGALVQDKKLMLDVEPNALVVRIAASQLFEASTGALTASGKQLLGEVAKPLRARTLRVQISEWAPRRTKAERKVHIRQVAGALHSAGLELEQLTMQDIEDSASGNTKAPPAPHMVLKVWRVAENPSSGRVLAASENAR
jgi:septal ring factor EnvC (AmiA/AmiB activator)